MVSGDGYEYERKVFRPLFSRGGGIQFRIPPLLGKHHRCAWQGGRAEPRLFAELGEVCGSHLRRSPFALMPFVG
jgi:hypothetical protein